ncbi:DUF5320 domain-containing protein [Candidatus Aerophobetes bacterium]|uniref:DUF5320 domain-containing protein n=1 Tax=Aerophobetes bacterium TaxID=2030807 RepID=A0A7V5LZX8_UNCAE|nr:DUF5320 domain-containing protein [Candidatus Aerophobetes bacterium]HHF99015.1 hypothetical protein [Candidatus Aerophobetes bacterium]
MPGYRHRYMYYATGLPGWMRFGFSPGWLGASPTGMGPGATYLLTGRWPTPQAQAAWQAMQTGGTPYAGATPPSYFPQPGAQPSKEEQLQFLRNQAEYLRQELEKIKEQIDRLEK